MRRKNGPKWRLIEQNKLIKSQKMSNLASKTDSKNKDELKSGNRSKGKGGAQSEGKEKGLNILTRNDTKNLNFGMKRLSLRKMEQKANESRRKEKLAKRSFNHDYIQSGKDTLDGKNQHPKVRFIYSKMRDQISAEFRKYIDERVSEMTKDDSQVSIDCGPRCFNRLICTECEIKSCPVGLLCKNRRFQRQENKLVYPRPTPTKGWGLFAMNPIKKGDFVIQYLGEIFSVTSQLGIGRLYQYASSTCTYLMKLSPKEVIDPTTKGNVARFINHSCNPNCVTQKWNVMGEVFVGIFAKKDIARDQELTFDYKFDVYKTPFLECFCGAIKCKGYLGLAGRRPGTILNINVPLRTLKGSTNKSFEIQEIPQDVNTQVRGLNQSDLIELKSSKKGKKRGAFILKKTGKEKTELDVNRNDYEDDDLLSSGIVPKKRQLIFEDDDEGPIKKKGSMKIGTEDRLDLDLDQDNDNDKCEICKKSIYCPSDSEEEENSKPDVHGNNSSKLDLPHISKQNLEDSNDKVNKVLPCTNCPANFHFDCIQIDKCTKCGHHFSNAGSEIQEQESLNELNQDSPNNFSQRKRSSLKPNLDFDEEGKQKGHKRSESLDSEELEKESLSQVPLNSNRKESRWSGDSKAMRKGSENLSLLGRSGTKSDFRTKKKQQFKIITEQIIAIFDRDFPESKFKAQYFGENNRLKRLCSVGTEPSTDFSHFMISSIELAIFKQRGTRIFLKQTDINVFWNNSDISYKNFFARNSELRCNCRPEEEQFVADLLKFIEGCVVSYRESSGSIDNSFKVPAIFLKRVLGEYYRNSKYVEKEFSVKLGFERTHVTDECYPIHFMTVVRLRGRSENIKKAHEYIVCKLRSLVARRKYMTREDIKIIISKLQQIKRNINPTEIRCCRDNALRDINHTFYTIYYKDKEVAFIGTKEQVLWAEKFVMQVIENNRRLEENPLALNFIVPGNEKSELIHIKSKAEKKFPQNRLIIYDSLPPKKLSSLTFISTFRKFSDFFRFVRREIDESKICPMLFEDFQKEQLFQKSKAYFKNLMNCSLNKSFGFIKTWDSLSAEFSSNSVHFESLYKMLTTRVLGDFEFQFFLLYVNNLVKQEQARKDMGLTNSVIIKILFIMLCKELNRFDEKSIFKGKKSKVKKSRRTEDRSSRKKDKLVKRNFETFKADSMLKNKSPSLRPKRVARDRSTPSDVHKTSKHKKKRKKVESESSSSSNPDSDSISDSERKHKNYNSSKNSKSQKKKYNYNPRKEDVNSFKGETPPMDQSDLKPPKESKSNLVSSKLMNKDNLPKMEISGRFKDKINDLNSNTIEIFPESSLHGQEMKNRLQNIKFERISSQQNSSFPNDQPTKVEVFTSENIFKKTPHQKPFNEQLMPDKFNNHSITVKIEPRKNLLHELEPSKMLIRFETGSKTKIVEGATHTEDTGNVQNLPSIGKLSFPPNNNDLIKSSIKDPKGHSHMIQNLTSLPKFDDEHNAKSERIKMLILESMKQKEKSRLLGEKTESVKNVRRNSRSNSQSSRSGEYSSMSSFERSQSHKKSKLPMIRYFSSLHK